MRTLVAVLLLVFATPARADVFRFCVRIPSTNAMVLYAGTDSATVVCGDSGVPTHDVGWLKMWRLPVSGGTWTCRDSFDVRGLEGADYCDSLDAGIGGHFYATAKDISGNETCPSEDILYHGPVTSVPVDAVKIGTLHVKLFTVAGALAQDPMAQGIYFWKGWDDRGIERRRGKIAVLGKETKAAILRRIK